MLSEHLYKSKVNEKMLISAAYIYPVCPLSMNHARMFLVSDIIARHARAQGKKVFFPIASHYSGNTAHQISKIFIKLFSNANELSANERQKYYQYRDWYKTPIPVLKGFIDPLNILNFYNQETLWELKSLRISGDYDCGYTTEHVDFTAFINAIITCYEKHGLLIHNNKGELALDYNNEGWRSKTIDLINRTAFVQSFLKKNVVAAVNHIKSDWGLLREDGIGVKYKGKWIIDPMFDSEIFSIFDLYMKYRKDFPDEIVNPEDFFSDMFETLRTHSKVSNGLSKKITDWLPCDIFICEEHLKNWVVKKLFAERCLLGERYRTKKYFLLGMGFLNGRRMSASRGHAILTKDLINKYGSIKARLIMILAGGHPSKNYNYDENLPLEAEKLLDNFVAFYTSLVCQINYSIRVKQCEKEEATTFEAVCKGIEDNICKGYYRQVVIELLSLLPKKIGFSGLKNALVLQSIYEKYLDIFLPGLLDDLEPKNISQTSSYRLLSK